MEDYEKEKATHDADILLPLDPKSTTSKGDLKPLYAEYVCLSPRQRMEVFGFHLKKEFAAHYGVTGKTLAEWAKDPRFQKMKRELYLQRVDKKLPQVIDSMLDRAIEGDVAAGKEVLKVAGLSIDRVEIKQQSQINILMIGIIESINKHIDDPTIINAIASDIERLADDIGE